MNLISTEKGCPFPPLSSSFLFLSISILSNIKLQNRFFFFLLLHENLLWVTATESYLKKKFWTVFLYTFLNILNAYREYKSWYFKPNSPQENYKEFKHSFTLPTLQSSKINKVKMLLKGLKLVFAFTTNNTNDELAEKKTRVAKNYTSSTVPRDFSFRKQTGSESLSTSPGKKSEWYIVAFTRTTDFTKETPSLKHLFSFFSKVTNMLDTKLEDPEA